MTSITCASSKLSLVGNQGGMNRQRRDRPTPGRGDGQVRARRDVSSREDVAHRGAVLVIDDDESLVIPLASELHTQVVRGVVADREEDALAVDHALILEYQRAHFGAV